MTLESLKARIRLSMSTEADKQELLQVARILPADYEAARAMWHRYAPLMYRGLLDGSGFHWNAETQQYQTREGVYLPYGKIKALAEEVIRRAKKDQESMLLLMLFGAGVSLTPTLIKAWQRKAAGAMKSQYLAMGALGAGGFANLTPRINAVIVGHHLVEQPSLAFSIDRLARFGQAIGSGQAGTKDAIESRLGQYSDTSYGVMEEARRQSHEDAVDLAGIPLFTQERNILDDDPGIQHCHTTAQRVGCPELTKKGWVPIGSMPAPGSRQCLGRCRCHMAYRRAAKAKQKVA